MIAIPSQDPVGALVPHTLKEPLVGARSGPLAGLTFMVKDLFAIKGRKVGNGNPELLRACDAGARDGTRDRAPARLRRLLHRHHHLR